MSSLPPSGRLYGIGVGPGDPELLTVKAVRLIQAAPVVGYFAKAGRRGNARGIVDRWMTGNAVELPLHYPMTTEHAFDSPVYVTVLAAFYENAVAVISAHLDAGRDVALLSEGDPLFYGSFMHLHIRLRARYPVTLVPGVTGMAGCWAAAAEPMTRGDDTLLVVRRLS
jgi:precorrin-2/cobalt-factor-2 C20-methyltransferase